MIGCKLTIDELVPNHAMKNFREQIHYGLLAIDKGFLTQEALGLAVQQWLNSSSVLNLGDFLVHSGTITNEQRQELLAGLETTCVLSPQETAMLVIGETPQENPSDETSAFQSSSQAKPIADYRLPDKDKRFKIVKQHASGGLGVVFVARDLQINRDVALKQIRGDRRQDDLSESKFMLEAEITGQLEHPGIVPVYALGIDAEGAPYYAMRFIRGRELKQFIKEFHEGGNGMPRMFDGVKFRQLIGRFLDVCNAIDYAHSRGILHRDLKPANIMLGNHGETLVVDWGLAKLISSKPSKIEITESAREFPVRVRSSGSNSETVYGSFSGTVAYASPEQLQGQLELLGPVSDVYSLGAILYEILTNQPPITKRPQSMSQVVEWIRAGEVPSAKSVVKIAPRALSIICQKAMAFEIAARYGSAGELASDLERWLADERVLAFGNREPVLEIAGRWMRRYRSWTVPVAAALVFSTLVVVIGAWLINRSRIAEIAAKSDAVQYKNEAVDRIGVARNAIDTMLINSTEALRDFPATLDLQAQLLQAAIDDYAKLSQGSSPDNELELERVRARVRVGDILHMQGHYDSAYLKYLDVIAETELRVNRFDKGRTQDLVAWKIELGKAQARLGLAYDLEFKEGRIVDAREQFQKGIAILKTVAGGLDADHLATIALARIQVNFANSQSMDSQTTEALALIENSLKLYSVMDLKRDKKVRLASLQALESASRVLGRMGRASDALKYLDMAMTSAGSMLLNEPEDREILKFKSSAQNSRATIRRRQGDWELALGDLKDAWATYDQLRKRWPENLDFIESSALTQTDIGLLLLDRMEPLLAKEYLERSLADFKQLFGSYPQIQRYADGLATTWSGLGQAEMQTNMDPNPAINLLVESYNLFDRLFQESDNKTGYAFKMATTKGQLAQAMERTDQREDALQLWTEAESQLKQLIDLGNSQTETVPDYEYALSQVEWKQALLEWDEGDQQKSKAMFLASIERLERLTAAHPSNGQYACELSRALIRCPNVQVVDLQRADLLAFQAMSSQPQNLEFLRLQAECKLQMGLTMEAKKYLDMLPLDSPTSQDLGLSALYEFRLGDREKAHKQLKLMKEQLNKEQPYVVELQRWYEALSVIIGHQ